MPNMQFYSTEVTLKYFQAHRDNSYKLIHLWAHHVKICSLYCSIASFKSTESMQLEVDVVQYSHDLPRSVSRYALLIF